jgi:hypothetical protein
MCFCNSLILIIKHSFKILKLLNFIFHSNYFLFEIQLHTIFHCRKEYDPDPDQQVIGTDPQIRIRSDM